MRLKFHEPMPFSRGLEREIVHICISGGAVLLIFYLLHPFRFGGLSSLKLLGYGVVSVLAGIIYVVLSHYFYKTLWANRKWTLGWEILHSLLFLLFIGFSIMTYGSLLHITELTFTNVLLYLFYTVVLGLIPVTIRAVLVRDWRLKNDLSEAKKINELLANRKLASDEKIIEFNTASSKGVLKINTHDLLYVEAAENYINVVWENNHTIRKEMIRMTMKDAIRQWNDPLIVFSHRSFIINLRKVKKISSQSGFSTMTLKDVDTPIPLSATYKKEIKQKLREFQ
jgi:hypothetical protein